MFRPSREIAAVLTVSLLALPPAWGQDPPRWAAPPLEQAVSVRDGRTDQVLPFSALLDELAKADVVFIGENHTDETTHRVELAIYDGLLTRRHGRVTLAMEMFERDVQGALNSYLKGEIDEPTFLGQSRPWANYRTAYRPLIERAKQAGAPVIASNFPRPLIGKIAAEGPQVLQQLPDDQKSQAPDQLLPNSEQYWRRVDNAIRGHAGMVRESDRLHSTQSLWDNAMGDSCARALDQFPDSSVVHINGGFHTSFWEGTVHQLKSRKPDVNVKVVSIAPVTNPSVVKLQGAPSSDYVIFAETRATDINDGQWSVYTQRETKYALHLPPSSQTSPVPLVILLVDDGLVANDGMEYWKERLGNEAALLVLEPSYKETQEDQGVGGRWFWADSFTSDIGQAITAVEEAWAYAARHYPIDPQRVCVAGEGTGGTVAAAVGLLTDRIDVHAVAVAPRQFAKLKDFALPLPEDWGNESPPQRFVTVSAPAGEEGWWQAELRAYDGVQVRTQLVTVDADPWKRESQGESLLRLAVGLAPVPEPPRERAFLLLESDAPRARHWARMQSQRLAARDQVAVAVLADQPDEAGLREISTAIRPESFSVPGALPRCPGPFGGTTVLLLPETVTAAEVRDWLALEANDPLAKQSRFHRLRIATSAAERSLAAVLAKLQSENRKNILIVPAVFHADSIWLRAARRSVREFENQMTLQWSPGLGSSPHVFAAAPADNAGIAQRHDLVVGLEPATHRITVEDRIQLPPSLRREGTTFRLNRVLAITSSSLPLESIAEDDPQAPTAQYRLKEPSADGLLTLAYAGPMHFGLSDQKEEYTRGFRNTPGMLAEEGVYLDKQSVWIPTFGDQMLQFSLDVTLPDGWQLISQGKGTARDANGHARWESDDPMEEIYLVGGPLHLYRDVVGAIELQVFLREPDEALARKYLDTGARYMEMYRQMIGPYPYAKFALVENFWETGYGMPSFTLLGPQVIRFPFILHSSYPHEILHNWWGNSVFVNFEQGNWCEGLTAYLSDHLIQEQRGTGAEYRRNTLQKYRDYVRANRDFPLKEFHSRHSAATEAVGYGKALMLFHMVRRRIGDDAFRAALADFYRRHRGERASFSDLKAAFDAAPNSQLGTFFDQWVSRLGSPKLVLHGVQVVRDGEAFVVTGTLEQAQDAEPFELDVPLVLQTASGTHVEVIAAKERTTPFRLQVDDQPMQLAVDPLFDLFRYLDPRETPPTIGQIFGQSRITAVLPATSSDTATRDRYCELIEAWRSDDHAIDVVTDQEVADLPADRCVWVLGQDNRFAPQFLEGNAETVYAPDKAIVTLANDAVPLADHSIVAVRRHPKNEDLAIGWLVVDPPAAFAGMARKLPHYGKYSYLAFEGAEPTNTVKGQHTTAGSPLVVDLRQNRAAPATPLALESRRALAELPPVFSRQRLMEHVQWLAAPEREGRGLGSRGLEDSAEYIAKAMADAGLQPGGNQGTWFQEFQVAKGPDGSPVTTKNVVGVLPGKRADWSEQSIVVGAHYDHLGRGWPDVHEGDSGQIHPGADDNASGIAVLLELARILAAEGGGSRNLVFIAFSAEECGRLGSLHYVEAPRFPLAHVRGVINMDTVGRLFAQPLAILGTGNADEWQHIFRGCTFVTGIPSKNVPEATGGSDQMSFIERGIPGVQIFTGAHSDYHRPSDTVDKVDADGLVKVATFVKEAVAYLVEREPPLTVRIEAAPAQSANAAAPQAGGRRVVFGAVPAFDYQGEGVKFESLVPDSPAARAGLQAGDVLRRLDEEAIQDLQGFSNALRRLKPGQKVKATIQRGNDTLEVEVQVEKR